MNFEMKKTEKVTEETTEITEEKCAELRAACVLRGDDPGEVPGRLKGKEGPHLDEIRNSLELGSLS